MMWYRRPARDWLEALPVGNGRLGAMVFGAPEKEHLALNHEWLWRAKGRYRDWGAKHQHLAEIREMFFAGKTEEAGELAKERLLGPADMPKRVDPYVPAGDLWIDFGHRSVPGFTSDYRRELDLASAVARTSYRYCGVQYTREVIAHSALPVIALRLTSSRPNGITCVASITRTGDAECRTAPSSAENGLTLEGTFVEGGRFAVEAKVIADGGELEPVPGFAMLRLTNCREALVILTIGVAHDGEDPRLLCREQLEVPGGWSELLETHKREHARMYSAVSLDLGASRDEKPTDERLEEMREGAEENGLFALYFNFGRYLLISSSRPGGLPANLQGIWNDDPHPPWESDFHHDINLQMNYWPAEVCGLAELIEPLFEHVERLVPHGREMARKLYGCEGVLPLQTDPWGRATPESRQYALWIGAAAWLAQHFWWRYEYGLDREFLRNRVYPLLKEVAAFYETYLVHDPQGRLVPVPSQSPENQFVGGCTPVSLCIGATMDLELIHDCLSHAILASEVLDCDTERRERWRRILEEIPPLQIGRHGQIQEWLEDYEEVDVGHVHFSLLFALFPGDQITPEEEQELAAAARISIERRLAAGSGDRAGWPRAWAACLWARLQDGDRACENLKALLTDHTTTALLSAFPLPPPLPARVFQIDANLGGTAAVAEMLLQSHRGEIHILPALPSAWSKGRVTGLRARGGYVVDIEWEAGRPETVTVHSRFEGPCTIRHGREDAPEVTCGSEPVEVTESGKGIVVFTCGAGKEYNLRW